MLVLLPGGRRKRGKWLDDKIVAVRDDGSIICGTDREKKTIAPEDVRALPNNELAAATVRAQHGVSHTSDQSRAKKDGRKGVFEINAEHESSSSEEDTFERENYGGNNANEHTRTIKNQATTSRDPAVVTNETGQIADSVTSEDAESEQQQEPETPSSDAQRVIREVPKDIAVAPLRRSAPPRKPNPKYFSHLTQLLLLNPLSRAG